MQIAFSIGLQLVCGGMFLWFAWQAPSLWYAIPLALAGIAIPAIGILGIIESNAARKTRP